MQELKDIGAKAEARMWELKMRKSELHEKSKVARHTIDKVFAGEIGNAKTIIKLSKALKMRLTLIPE